ncbi:hypothetical protein [Alicyclobacillus fodiniaquatilis]|uniref:Uncharacterized protein n=1 Tax=Alicyclobacillus fodiniaquatilis TaxID=1661150 RepID=A0ABW4JBB6_9BACL
MTTDLQTSDKTPPTKPKKPNPDTMGELALKQAKYFDVVLTDGEIWNCKLLEYGRYDLLVETELGKILIPKHSIKYFIVEKNED